MKTRLLSLCFVLALLLSLLPAGGLTALAAGAEPDTTWYNENASEFIISSTAQLEGLAELVNDGNSFSGKTVRLADTFSNTTALTTPIGNDSHPFQGTFDGNGKTVELAMNITGTNAVFAGLFGYVGEHGTVQNVSTSGTVKASSGLGSYAGGVVAFNNGGAISNCSASGDVTASGGTHNYPGGVVGYNATGIVSNCFASGTVTASGGAYSYAGGVVGYNTSGTVSNCFASGTVTVSGGSVSYAGGVVGYNDSSGTVSNCFASGGVTASGGATNTAGGVVGRNESSDTVSNCYCLNKDSGGAEEVISVNSGTVSNCYALPETQMKAGAGVTSGDNSWKEIIVNGSSLGKVSLVDALNAYVEVNPDKGYMKWKTDGSNYLTLNPLDGNGTLQSPYLIHDTAQLETLAGLVNSGISFADTHLRLADDFDGSTPLTTPIGNGSHPFQGTFDGNGKTVALNITGVSSAGLFGVVEGGTVVNVSTSGTVAATGDMTSCSGGVVGQNYQGTIVNCCAAVTVTSTVTGENGIYNYSGGVVGHNLFESTVTNCYATGAVTATGNAKNYSGGVAGYTTYNSTVTNCYAAGTVTASGDTKNFAGGVAGYNNATVTNCNYKSVADLWGVGTTDGTDAATSEASSCTALPADQMTAGAGVTNAAWTALNGKSMVDALNSYVQGNPSDENQPSLRPWGVMDNLNGGYPVFALDTPMYLNTGKAYADPDMKTEIPLPAGIAYDKEQGTYTFENVILPSLGGNYLTILDDTAAVRLAGQNQLGAKASFTTNAENSALYGLSCIGAVTFTGSGTLTAYGKTAGIHANRLTVTLDGGSIRAKGGTAAITVKTALTIADTLTVNGAKETYDKETIQTLTNDNAAEYVTIQPRQTSSKSKSNTTNITVKVGDTTETVKGSCSNGKVSIYENQLKKWVETGVTGLGESLEISAANQKKTVTGYTLPTETVMDIADSGCRNLAFAYSDGSTLSLDNTALSAVATQAAGKSVTFLVDTTEAALKSLTADQRTYYEKMASPKKLVEVTVSSGGKEIHDLQGGKATATVSVSAEGKKASVCKLVNPSDISESLAAHILWMPSSSSNGTVTFQTGSLSHYVILILEDGTQICPKDSTCVYAKFTDADPTAWYHDGVHFCVEKAYMDGVGGGQFAPNGTLSRAMLVTMLWRMEGSPVVNYAMTFDDVAADKWYTEAVRWAADAEIVDGYSDTAFGPNDNVTREQLAAILMRYADFKGVDVSARNDLAAYTDAKDISAWALENLRWANAVEMIKGRTETTIAPTGSATRAEAATMLYRFCMTVLG